MTGVIMAQWVEYYPCKQKGLSLVPRNHVKMLGMAACTCNPGLGRKRWEDSWDSFTIQPILFVEFQATERPDLMKQYGT